MNPPTQYPVRKFVVPKKRHFLDIGKVVPPNNDNKEKVPPKMRGELFPGFPTTTVMVGQPGSGKTNLLVYMLTSDTFYKGFFDKVYLFGLTCKSDDLYKAMKVPEENITTDVEEILPRLKELLEQQQDAVQQDWNSAPKILMIFEDLTSLYRKVQNSMEFIRCYTQVRHLKGSSIAMVHKYKAMERTARMASKHVICFQVNQTDISQLYEDFTPTWLTKKEFIKMASYAMEPTEEEPHPFFYVNLQAPEKTRFRRCFKTFIQRKGAGPIKITQEETVGSKRKMGPQAQTAQARKKKFMGDLEEDKDKELYQEQESDSDIFK